jgi:NAD(P)-dependent dehydrogenase (short-subunit alcohol dehydrogenase family)
MDMQNKRVVVTGANGALGRAVAERARALGAHVVGLDLAAGDGTANQSLVVDLLDMAATLACFDRIGSFDALFNVAGGFAMGAPVWDASDEQWELMFRVNVTTLRNALRAAVPRLLAQGHGSIVNVGAYGALSGKPGMSAYCAAKSAVMRLTESLADEVRHRGVNVNAVLPTMIDTPANRAAMPDADPAQWVSPTELANVICFLGSDAAAAVHGALVPVRGLC